MAIIHLQLEDRLHLQSIASLFGAASKIVTIAGAGISTNAGIPVRIPASFPGHLSPDLGPPIEKWCLFPRPSSCLLLFLGSLRSKMRPLFYSGITKMRQEIKHASPTRVQPRDTSMPVGGSATGCSKRADAICPGSLQAAASWRW